MAFSFFYFQKLEVRQKGYNFLSQEDQEKASQVLSMDYTSSDDDTQSEVRDVHILQWESEELALLKKKMEQGHYANAKPAEKKGAQMKARKVRLDVVSERVVPKNPPTWAVKEY